MEIITLTLYANTIGYYTFIHLYTITVQLMYDQYENYIPQIFCIIIKIIISHLT